MKNLPEDLILRNLSDEGINENSPADLAVNKLNLDMKLEKSMSWFSYKDTTHQLIWSMRDEGVRLGVENE
jgi:hypothetical protein